MKIADNLYRATPDQPPTTGMEYMIRTEGQRWYTTQVAKARREAQDFARRRGWGLAGRFPSEAREVE